MKLYESEWLIKDANNDYRSCDDSGACVNYACNDVLKQWFALYMAEQFKFELYDKPSPHRHKIIRARGTEFLDVATEKGTESVWVDVDSEWVKAVVTHLKSLGVVYIQVVIEA